MKKKTKKSRLRVECPKCGTKFEYYSSDFRPFCTEKCKMVDLGHWLSESYTVAAVEMDDDEIDKLEEILQTGDNNEEE